MVPSNKIETRIYETTVTYDSVRCLCYDAIAGGFASVQVFPCMIEECKALLDGTDIKINALISYPHGGFSIAQKAAEAKECVGRGAQMVEVVVNAREAKSHNYDYILREMEAVKQAVGTDVFVKFNLEIESLTMEEAAECCKMAVQAGIDCVSTSTGLYHTLDENKNDVPLVTTVEEVTVLKEAAQGKVQVQAEGNIASSEVAEKLLAAGADIISTEHAIAVAG